MMNDNNLNNTSKKEPNVNTQNGTSTATSKDNEDKVLNKGNDQTNCRDDSFVQVNIEKLEFDIFFDGTWNSKENSDWYNNPDNKFGQRSDEERMKKKYNPGSSSISFARAPTGVDQMHRASDQSKPHIIPLYVDGAGAEIPELQEDGESKKYKKDNIIGAGLGWGDTGVYGKLNNMFSQIKEKISNYNSKQCKPVVNLIFNVYGFSRGAATARMFCNRIILRRDDKDVKKYLDLTGYNVTLKMVGLFDTVSSIGGDHTNDVEEDHEGLDFKKEQVTGKIVHFLAAHEFRQKFNVTNIKKAVENGYGFELAFPGCHTDLGDGLGTEGEIRDEVVPTADGKENIKKRWHVSGKDEKKTILQKYRVFEANPEKKLLPSLNLLSPFMQVARSESKAKKEQAAANFEEVMKILVAQDWYNYDEDFKEIGIEKNMIFEMLKVERKQLSSDYPKIPTFIMLELVKKYGAYHLLNSLLKKYDLASAGDPDLFTLYDNFANQVLAMEATTDPKDLKWVSEIYNNKQHEQPYIDIFNNPELKKRLYNRYLHWGGEMGRKFIDLSFTQVNVTHIDYATNQFYREVIEG